MKLYLHSIAYQLGESAPITELSELTDGLSDMFQALGLSSYAHSPQEPYALAIGSAKQTLSAADLTTDEVGLVVYATNTLTTQNHSRDDLRRLCCELGLEHAFALGVFSWECSNLYLAIMAAADSLRAGRALHALVVTTDRCLPGESRILPPNLTVLSDGACSFLLSVTPPRGTCCFAICGAGSFSDPALARVDPETQLGEFFNRITKGIVSASSRALEQGGMRAAEVAAVVANNYNLSIMRTFAIQIGYDIGRAYLKNLPRFAHAFAADTVINLRDLDDSGGLAAGAHCLLIASGPTAWGALTLAKYAGA